MDEIMETDVLKKMERTSTLKDTLQDCMDKSFSKMISTDRVSRRKQDDFVVDRRLVRKIDELASDDDIETESLHTHKLNKKYKFSRKKQV